MAFDIDFRCGVQNGSGGGFCFGGSTCFVDEAGVESCQGCAAGFEHDYTWGHFDNCNMPDMFLPIFITISTASALMGVITFSYIYGRIHTSLKQVAKIYMLLLVVEWCENLALYIQRGRFAVTLSVTAVRGAIAIEFNVQIFFILFKSLSPLLRPIQLERLRIRLRKTVYAPLLLYIIFILIQAGFARQSNDVYNAIAAMGFLFSMIFFSWNSMSCIMLINRILSVVRNSKQQILPEGLRALWRLSALRYTLAYGTAVCFSACLYSGLTLLVIGSTPYAWLTTVFFNGFGFAFPAFAVFAVRYSQSEARNHGAVISEYRYPVMNQYSFRSRPQQYCTTLSQLPPSVPVWFDVEERSVSTIIE